MAELSSYNSHLMSSIKKETLEGNSWLECSNLVPNGEETLCVGTTSTEVTSRYSNRQSTAMFHLDKRDCSTDFLNSNDIPLHDATNKPNNIKDDENHPLILNGESNLESLSQTDTLATLNSDLETGEDSAWDISEEKLAQPCIVISLKDFSWKYQSAKSTNAQHLTCTKNAEQVLCSPKIASSLSVRAKEMLNTKWCSPSDPTIATQQKSFLMEKQTKKCLNGKLLRCLDCGSLFPKKLALTRHMHTHSAERPFRCTECAKHFFDNRLLTSHLQMHVGEEPFKCSQCFERFSCKSSLTVHKCRQTGTRSFQCTKCGKEFSQKVTLTIHLQVHAKDMNFTVEDIKNMIRQQLQDVPDSEREGYCKEFEKHQIDGQCLIGMTLDTLLKLFPKIPYGHLLKINQGVQQLNGSVVQSELSETDTIPLYDNNEEFDSNVPALCTSSEKADDVSDCNSPFSSMESTVSSSTSDDQIFNDTTTVLKKFPIHQCQFGIYAKELITTGEITFAGKREVTSALINAMSSYQRVPSRSLRRSAVDEFIKLGKASLGLSSKEAKTFWLKKVSVKINNKMKQQRRRSSYPKCLKRRFNNQSGSADTNGVKRKKSLDFEELSDNENSSLEAKESLLLEFKKPKDKRNGRSIAKWMKVTFPLRRKYISVERPDPEQLTKEWPALSLFDELVREFNRMKPGVLSNRKVKKVGKTVMSAVLRLAKLTCSRSMHVKRLFLSQPIEEKHDTDTTFLIAFQSLCYILPTNTKKTSNTEKYLLDFYPANFTFDDIKMDVSDRNQPFLAVQQQGKTQKILLVAENHIVLELQSAFSAVYCLIAYHYVMNYEYCAHVKKALEFIERYILKLSSTKVDSVYELALQLKL